MPHRTTRSFRLTTVPLHEDYARRACARVRWLAYSLPDADWDPEATEDLDDLLTALGTLGEAVSVAIVEVGSLVAARHIEKVLPLRPPSPQNGKSPCT